jgi:hypothetical protein
MKRNEELQLTLAAPSKEIKRMANVPQNIW